MKKDFRAQRAQRDAEARHLAERQRNFCKTIVQRANDFFKHDFADPVGYSPTWESSSPNRHATLTSTTGWDPNKTPGTGD